MPKQKMNIVAAGKLNSPIPLRTSDGREEFRKGMTTTHARAWEAKLRLSVHPHRSSTYLSREETDQ